MRRAATNGRSVQHPPVATTPALPALTTPPASAPLPAAAPDATVANVPSQKAVTPDEAPGRDVISIARDITILLAFFVYIVGYASHFTFLDRVGFGHDFTVGSIYDLISWTGDAVSYGVWPILGTLVPFAGLLLCASFCRTRDFGRHGRIVVGAIVGTALVVGYSASYLAGTSIGMTQYGSAIGEQNGTNPYGPQILLQRSGSTMAEAPCAVARTKSAPPSDRQYYLMAESHDTFQIVEHGAKDKRPWPMGFRKDTIECYVLVPHDVMPSGNATPTPTQVRRGQQTPPPGLLGYSASTAHARTTQ
jgi:hypothetical protein